MSTITRSFAPSVFLAIGCLALAACGGSGSGSSSGNGGAPAVDSPSVEPPTANSAPRISGTPDSSVVVGKSYEFLPQAADADGDPLEFSGNNIPTWAQFDRATGRLSGTPDRSDIGSYASIAISVSDGRLSATLPVFAISVEAEDEDEDVPGSARLKWKAPSHNEDGSKVRNLAGFRIYYGQDPSNLANRVEIPAPNIKKATIEELTEGTWYFAVTAYTTSGLESDFSTIASKTIG
jgi:hypothetical protein